jgi:hypothetical protein
MVLYSIQGTVISKIDNLPVPYAKVEIFEVDRSGVDYRIDLIAATDTGTSHPTEPGVLTERDGRFSCSFDYPSPPRPDIIFRVSQNISGVTHYIYNESPAFHTRWSIGDVLFVNLKVEEYCITGPPSSERPATDHFIFTRVGNIGVDSISQTTGYAYPDIDPGLPNVTQSNLPFGRTLWIAGWFGSRLPPFTHYKIQYSPGLHSAVDAGPWNDIHDALSNSYFEWATPSAPISHWVTKNMGPSTHAGVSNLYVPPDHMDVKPWVFPDLLIRWDTTKVTDGLYTLRVLGFSVSAGAASPVPLNPEPTYGTLKVIIDNTPPEHEITRITHMDASGGGAEEVGPCKIIEFKGILSVEFKVHDPKGHLGKYSLIPHYGHNNIVVPSPTLPNKAEDEYANHIATLADPQKWYGSTSLRTEYKRSPPEPDSTGYSSAEMPECAYQFRLVVDKRTTNGYGRVYYAYEDNIHITLGRPCPPRP